MTNKKIWLSSDYHFCHNKPFLYEPRGFNNVWDMNKDIIEKHNSCVNMIDDVYILGDLMLNNNEEGLKCIKQLKGSLHIILGNHCTDTRIELYKTCYNIVEIVYATRLNYKGYHFYLSHYPTFCSNFDDNKSLKSKTINLCGHSHITDPFGDWNRGVIYHVEVDAHNCYPVLLDNIINDINKKLNN